MRAVEELPVTPFEALRVSFGMLLGEEDFHTLMGNPRGKQMLHSSWLHGSGVVWGFPVDVADDGQLRVGPGLAVDGLGRELALHAPRCLDVAQWAAEQRRQGRPAASPGDPCEDPAVTVACLVASHDLCPTRPVPALADPCDQQRTTTEPSRLVETVHLDLQPDDCPQPPAAGPYHRVRVLLGLDQAEPSDPAGQQAADALAAVLGEPPGLRVRSLLLAFRRLLASDIAELRPADPPVEGRFPLPEERSCVPLARISITHHPHGGDTGGLSWQPDLTVRRGLMATSAIQEFACALAPGLLGDRPDADAGGPRVIRDSVDWDSGNESALAFRVTRPLRRGTLTRQQVAVSSLGNGGWDREDIDDLDYDGDRLVRLRLFAPPSQRLVQLVVRGTGPTPVTGTTGIPLAGMDDGQAGTEIEGHDAVARINRRMS